MHSSSVAGVNEKNIQELAMAIPHIKYKELVVATSDWSKDNILGRGGFGIVYKGRWKHTEVAIKKIVYHKAAEDSKKQAVIQLKQSLNELRHLNSCRHDNVLPLYGFSLDQTDGAEPCLVYQYMAGGSVERRLHSAQNPLSFHQRTRITLGTARGLQYLHTYVNGKPLIHGDIKPANILLDPCCVPKIGDFGLVREGSVESMEVSSVYGTRPYLPIEFIAKRTLSTKIDTYSFGVVLFELFTALRAHDKNRESGLAFLPVFMRFKAKNGEPLFPLLDKRLQSDTVSPTVYNSLMDIALICTVDNPDNRPEMVKVLNDLEKCLPIDDQNMGP